MARQLDDAGYHPYYRTSASNFGHRGGGGRPNLIVGVIPSRFSGEARSRADRQLFSIPNWIITAALPQNYVRFFDPTIAQ